MKDKEDFSYTHCKDGEQRQTILDRDIPLESLSSSEYLY